MLGDDQFTDGAELCEYLTANMGIAINDKEYVTKSGLILPALQISCDVPAVTDALRTADHVMILGMRK